jgi:cytochrome oxidase assembly protein ShyY1
VRSDAGRWLLTRIDIAARADGLGVPLAPRVLRLDPALPLGYARDLDVLPNTLPPERHRGYAVQWFGLALATLILALFLGFRRRPPA